MSQPFETTEQQSDAPKIGGINVNIPQVPEGDTEN